MPKKTKTKYNEFWERIEKCNAKLIPYALIALTLIIIIEIFFHIENLNFYNHALAIPYHPNDKEQWSHIKNSLHLDTTYPKMYEL